MDGLFLFCFRSCLRGDDADRSELYTILEIDSRASTEMIKKAFKKKSLSLHPDKLAQRGIEITDEHRLQYQQIKEAHDILSDPKRRKLYDQLGLTGLNLLENPNPVTLIKNFQKHRAEQCTIFYLLLFFMACFFILPILFVLKCDGTLGPEGPWVSIWTPMWLLDMIFIICSILLFVQPDEPSSMNEDENGNPIPSDEDEKVPIHVKIINLVTVIIFILIQIFVMIRLDQYTLWDWFGVFAPWFLYEVIQLVMCGITAFSFIPVPDYSTLKPVGVAAEGEKDDMEDDYKIKRAELGAEYYGELFERFNARNIFCNHLLRIWFIVFLASKLNGNVMWSWGIVLLPVWFYIFKQYMFAILQRQWGISIVQSIVAGGVIGEHDPSDDPESDMKRALGTMISNSSVSTIINTIPISFMSILLCCRLEAATFTTFVIILPIFLALSCGCCLVCCGFFFIVNADTDEMTRRMGGESGASVSSDERANMRANNMERGGSMNSNQGNGSMFYTPPDPVVTSPFTAENPTINGAGSVPTTAYDPHQPTHPITTATTINSSHSINDINLSIAMDNADRQAFAALYGPNQGQSSIKSSTSNSQSIPLSSSQYQSPTTNTTNNHTNTAINSNKNTSTVFIPPPPPPPSSFAESSDSSSSLSQHATSTSPLLPVTHIDVDID